MCEISGKGAIKIAEALAINNALTELNLFVSCCPIWPSLITITDSTSQDNQIGDVGAMKIAKALKINKTLTSLDLGVGKNLYYQ